MLGGEEGGQSMSNPVNRDTLIAYIEEKSGMNVPGWLQEVIMSCPAAVDALEEAYENGKRDAEPKWIPCSERLPKLNQICIVTDETRRCAYEYSLHYETYDDENGWTYLGHRIIAWMPLPEPWKEEEG